ncbi:unnamed protein product [Ectocarpus sp. CCAP 1310/34]|nr:unnamed protein product [Ectocarpus sp. CCAP 1310/34]
MGEATRAAAPHRSWWRWLEPSLTPPETSSWTWAWWSSGASPGGSWARGTPQQRRAYRERTGRERPGARASGHGREQAYVAYHAHDDGGCYEDYGDYDDGRYCDDGYYDAGYAHYAGGGDSYSYSSGVCFVFAECGI